MPRRLPKSPPRLQAWTRMFVGWALRGKRTVVGICTGAAAGLVAITPASGFVGRVGPMAIGVAAGIVCYWGCSGLKHMFSLTLSAFMRSAARSSPGVFAIEQYGGTGGLIEGNATQVFNQTEGVAIVFAYRRLPDHPQAH